MRRLLPTLVATVAHTELESAKQWDGGERPTDFLPLSMLFELMNCRETLSSFYIFMYSAHIGL